jgi:hypothetical protein
LTAAVELVVPDGAAASLGGPGFDGSGVEAAAWAGLVGGGAGFAGSTLEPPGAVGAGLASSILAAAGADGAGNAGSTAGTVGEVGARSAGAALVSTGSDRSCWGAAAGDEVVGLRRMA